MKLCFDFKKIAAILVFIILPSLVYAGGMEGGGGKSVVCRDTQGKITKAELLDLFEGRVQYQLKYNESQLSWEDQALEILTRSGLPISNMEPPFEISQWYYNAIKHLVILPEDVSLKVTNDSFEVVAPKGCKIEQTAIYQNDNQILINGEIWNFFSEIQKAALLIHESSYRYLRTFGETNSKRARHLTAYLLSNGIIEEPLPGSDYLGVCSGSGTSFHISSPFINQYGNESVNLQFYKIGGRKILSKNIIEFDSHIVSELKNPSPSIGNIYLQLKTKSLFESGDVVELQIGGPGSSEVKPIIFLRGVSSVDESNYEAYLSCTFH